MSFLALAVAAAAALPACVSSDDSPSVRVTGLSYPDLAIGHVVSVQVHVDPTDAVPRISTLDPTILTARQVGPARGGTYDVALESLAVGTTSLVIEVGDYSYTQPLGVEGDVAIDLVPLGTVAGREEPLWPASAKVQTGRTYLFQPGLRTRAADKRLMGDATFELDETDGVSWFQLGSARLVRVDVDQPGPVRVSIASGGLANAYDLVGVPLDAITGIELVPDLAPHGDRACVSAIGIDTEGDVVETVDVEWMMAGGLQLGPSDRVCYRPGEPPNVIGARLRATDAPVTVSLFGHDFRSRGRFTLCILCEL